MAFDQGLSHSLIEGNKQIIEQGRLLDSSISQGLFAFNPDMLFERLVKDYNTAEKIYGETFLRLITGEEAAPLKKKLPFPEFQRHLKGAIKQKILSLQQEELLDKKNAITERGLELASLVITLEELDRLKAKGLGQRKTKKRHHYGDSQNTRPYKKHDRYHDLNLKKTVKTALRRRHTTLHKEDLAVYERQDTGKIHLIYALDASGSMKGQKLSICKKAGIALAYKALEEKDNVGLLVFNSIISQAIPPTSDFSQIIKALSHIKAQAQTDIASAISKAIDLFPREDVTKHLILITDAAPTVGEDPLENTLTLAATAASLGITLSLIGIDLNEQEATFAQRLTDIGKGTLSIIKDLNALDRIVLEDYYTLNS